MQALRWGGKKKARGQGKKLQKSFFHWSLRTCPSATSLSSRNTLRVFGNPSWPLGVLRLHASMYCCTVFVVGRCGHFGPPRPSIGAEICFFPFTDGVRLSLKPHPSSVADGVGGQNLPSVIRSGRYRKMT
jgi:hypothetical protein